MTPSTKPQQYDVIVVGSGAAGGQSAYTLSMEGAKVLMLEAGRNYVPEQETPMFQTPSMPLLNHRAAAEPARGLLPAATGYGSDPSLTKLYRPGDAWPLTLSAAQRRTATALCNVILPGDDRSPSAESVGVVDFIDEWVSAPYPHQLEDRPIVLEGLAWMDAEALLRFEKYFAELDESRQRAICDDICYEPNAAAKVARAAKFFARYRDLTVGGYYSTPAGHGDLGYIGNVPLPRFDGPPAELLRKLGLGPEAA